MKELIPLKPVLIGGVVAAVLNLLLPKEDPGFDEDDDGVNADVDIEDGERTDTKGTDGTVKS
jgi:hypothetical protein